LIEGGIAFTGLFTGDFAAYFEIGMM